MNDTKRYLVMLQVDATVHVEVDANSAEEAEEIAWKQTKTPTLCHHCGREVTMGDYTGQCWVEEA